MIATEGYRQLMTVPGIGPIIASAMEAAIGSGTAFTLSKSTTSYVGPWVRSTRICLKFRPTCTLTNAVFRQRVRDPTTANGSDQATQND